MRYFYLFILICVSIITFDNQAFSQISITTNNMPRPGDTIRVSEALKLINEIPDPSITAFNFTWDYSALRADTQYVKQYVNPTQTPFFYQITFNPLVTNLALKVNQFAFVEAQITDAYEFYKNNNTGYTRAGYAATLSGLPIPLKFSQPEKIYTFPLTENSPADSSISTIDFQYGTTASFNMYRKRVNTVDGSGMLTTPYGTYPTLRMKSVIYERDSLYLDTIQMGIPIERYITEYHWLNPSFREPLLTITEENSTYFISYIDSVRIIVPLSVSINATSEQICNGQSTTLTAEGAGGEPPYNYIWSNMANTQSITVSPEVTTDYAVTVYDNFGNFAVATITITVDEMPQFTLGNDTTICNDLSYTLNLGGNFNSANWYENGQLKGTGQTYQVTGNNTVIVVKAAVTNGVCVSEQEINVTFEQCNSLYEISFNQVKIIPNPTSDRAVIECNELLINPSLIVSDITGRNISGLNWYVTEGRVVINTASLRQGMYYITVKGSKAIYSGKLIKM